MDPTARPPHPAYPEHLKAAAPGVSLADVRASIRHEADLAAWHAPRPTKEARS